MLDIVACIKDTKPQRNREMCFSAETDQEIYSCREIELGKCCDVMNQLGIYIASLVCSKLSWCPYFFRNKRCFLLHGMVVALRLGLLTGLRGDGLRKAEHSLLALFSQMPWHCI